jgi:hypothetical protein
MARKRQRVFKGGAEYEVTGAVGKYRRLIFLKELKLDGKEILLFRPVKKVKKLRT